MNLYLSDMVNRHGNVSEASLASKSLSRFVFPQSPSSEGLVVNLNPNLIIYSKSSLGSFLKNIFQARKQNLFCINMITM